MKLKTLIITLSLGLAAAVGAQAADEKIEKALRDLDVQWSAAASAKDLARTVSYYTKDAVLLAPDHKLAKTTAAIRAVWKEVLESDAGGSSWKPIQVQVSTSGDMAFMTGTYQSISKDAHGKKTTEHGKYLEVWAKQADGSWKCTADAWNADTAAKP